jgi:hypothetical protein
VAPTVGGNTSADPGEMFEVLVLDKSHLPDSAQRVMRVAAPRLLASYSTGRVIQDVRLQES